MLALAREFRRSYRLSGYKAGNKLIAAAQAAIHRFGPRFGAFTSHFGFMRRYLRNVGVRVY